jgi:hypothetical protein
MPRIKYQNIKLRADSLKLVGQCNTIIKEYQAQGFVLTLRQLYYQLVSRDIIANKQSEYKRVGAILNDARLAGLIDWKAMEDRTRNVASVAHWASPQDIITQVARQYHIDKWDDQPTRPEVWIEKDALTGVIEGVCSELDISYFSCRGYTSQSEMWEAAQRFIGYAKHGQTTRIIHLGDHDPSGQDMSRDIEERISGFMTHHGYGGFFDFTRVALNMDQIEQYKPPPNPAKSSDTRFEGYRAEYGDESWELDALAPSVFTQLIRNEVMTVRDEELWAVQVEREEKERELLLTTSIRWENVVSFLEDSDGY